MRIGQDIDRRLLDAIKAEGLDTVAGAFAHTGGRTLAKPNLRHRRRVKLVLPSPAGKEYELYMKLYGKERLIDRFRRWWTYGLGRSPAEIEFDNINAIRSAGIATMQAAICGRQEDDSKETGSYLIVTAVPGSKLEQCAPGLMELSDEEPEMVSTFTTEIAGLTSKMHRAGYVHRDFYSSHLLLDRANGKINLYLIDLARVFSPWFWRRGRWRVKDLAQLKYSAPLARWVQKCWPTFMREYLGTDNKVLLWWWDVRINLKVALMRLHNVRRERKLGA